MNALQFEAIKVALKQDATGFVLTLKIHPDEIPEELMRDFVGARYGVAMVRVNEDETPRSYTNRVKAAGILCRDARFHQYIQHLEGAVKVDEQDAVTWMHRYCGISSRSELNGNKKAQGLFDDLERAYEQWRGHDEPF